MKPIANQITAFFSLSKVKPASLAREARVPEASISYLRSGRRKDVYSACADALREAMMRLDPEAARKAMY